ncbi:hypothetical protein ACWFR5_02345 [Streptomyces sp. NPDC055092]
MQFVQRDSATGERAQGLDQQFARLGDELISMVQASIGVTVLSEVSRSLIPPDLVLLPLHPQTSRRLVLTGPRARPWYPAVCTWRTPPWTISPRPVPCRTHARAEIPSKPRTALTTVAA